jgi:2',3'-cyclic-nucleotide 2'-phosphodiesterase / 3'-nucleotidase
MRCSTGILVAVVCASVSTTILAGCGGGSDGPGTTDLAGSSSDLGSTKSHDLATSPADLTTAATHDMTSNATPDLATAPAPDLATSVPDMTAPGLTSGAKMTLGILEATDIHSTILSYDYFKLAEDKTIGLERAATLIKQARVELPNSILVDDGDAIQGTVLADYQALVSPVPCNQPLAMYKVMNALGFDVAGIGNHEFNYGLGYLGRVTHTAFDVNGVDTTGDGACAGPKFPQILSNVFSTKSNQTIFPPSTIVSKAVTVTQADGTTLQTTIKIGFLAFTPPQILNWDKANLDGKVITKGVQEVAAPIVADLRAQGADLVVGIIHGGLDNHAYDPSLENQAWYLAQVPGIDALLMGHSHQIFPNATSTIGQFNLPGVDKSAGTVNGLPALMANFWGQHLGVIKLGLSYDSAWHIDATQTVVEARPITTTCMGGVAVGCDAAGNWRTGGTCAFATACTGQADKARVYVDADPTIEPLIDAEHTGTIAYVKTPIGTTDFEMSTYFADVGDVGAIEIVNQAQASYVADYIAANLPQYAALPILSVSAPFKSGFQGGNDYTDVQAGNLAINNAADLYLYANTVYAVTVTGAQLQDWLEQAATRFLQIDPTKTTDQQLISSNPGYNFDLITDSRVSYEIDVTQPLPTGGSKASGRIKNLQFNGQPIDPAAQFIVATNNYRASGGGGFPGLDGSNTIYAAPDTNRDVLIAYIKKLVNVTRAANGSDRSWHFTKVATAGRVVFSSAENALGKAQAAGVDNVSLVLEDDGSGKALSLYAVDLSK